MTKFEELSTFAQQLHVQEDDAYQFCQKIAQDMGRGLIAYIEAPSGTVRLAETNQNPDEFVDAGYWLEVTMRFQIKYFETELDFKIKKNAKEDNNSKIMIFHKKEQIINRTVGNDNFAPLNEEIFNYINESIGTCEAEITFE